MDGSERDDPDVMVGIKPLDYLTRSLLDTDEQ